ncbi:MAG: 50S ribosomal protein L6 [Parcubacteria group bacterium 21-54-25]|nr:MAG: 50S ribosomal protein L6 [Parcubacteria group bacterium 21-54-25]HQU08254.1 50S ribosomal protein L6 [Candidatus Paceibacterota bacterium]
MSRFVKKPIGVPPRVEVAADVSTLSVKGPLGTLSRTVHPTIAITVASEGVSIAARNNSKLAKALSGTFAAHLKNMMAGVSAPFKKTLILEGVGYRVEQKGKELVFTVGFSHPVALPIPEGITAAVEKNIVRLEGIDKELVGQFAAVVRAVKPPEPYLGKGIRYEGEVIRRKQGKKSV